MAKTKKQTFDKLINESLPLLERHAEFYLGENDQDLCADAISRTLEEIWRDLPKLDRKKSPLPWMKKILERNCEDERRSKKRRDKNRIVLESPARGQGDDDHEEDDFESLVGRNIGVKWLPDGDGTLSPQSVEDFYRTLELTKKKEDYTREGVSLLDDFLKHPKPGQAVHDWYEDDGSWRVLLTWGDHWEVFGIKWDGPQEPPEIDKIRKLLKGIPKKAIAKKEGKSRGAIYTATHRVRKKIKK